MKTTNELTNDTARDILISRAGISDWIYEEHLRGLDDDAAEKLLDSFMDALTNEPNVAESRRDWFAGDVCRFASAPDDDDTTAWEAFEPILQRVYNAWAQSLITSISYHIACGEGYDTPDDGWDAFLRDETKWLRDTLIRTYPSASVDVHLMFGSSDDYCVYGDTVGGDTVVLVADPFTTVLGW